MSDITYAPVKKPVKGDFTLACIGMKFGKTNQYVTAGECRTMGNQIAKCYRNISRGLVNFKVSAFGDSVPYNASKKNLTKGEKYVMNKHKGFDYYALCNGFANIDHAGKNIAHLKGTLARTAYHEMGHVLGLGHAGSYDDKGKLDHYGDGGSFMSRYATNLLTAAQLYNQGWLREKEVALFDYNGPAKTYTIKRITALDKDDNYLVAVMIKLPNNQRDAFVSFPSWKGQHVLALHLSNGGGSQKVKMFGNEFYDQRFTGLLIKKISEGDYTITFSIEKQTTSVPSLLKDEITEDSFCDESPCTDVPYTEEEIDDNKDSDDVDDFSDIPVSDD